MSRLLEEFQQYLKKIQQYEYAVNLLFWDVQTKTP